MKHFFSKKFRENMFSYLRMFVSISIYILMLLVAVFIFYKVISLILYVAWYVYEELSNLIFNHESQISVLFIENILSTITFILILVKWFKILEFYAKRHHIEIKDLVEISIITLIMEVVFNFWVHSLAINILFAAVWIALLIIYAWMQYFRWDKHK